ncbi:MAG TPA: FHA domain-containing protein [Microcoleaceae cyanobacterium]
MLNLKPSSHSDQRTLGFLKQNPAISQSLLADLGHNLSQVATIIEPVLNAPSRCGISDYYIQAVTTGRTTFLVTNLMDDQAHCVTTISTSWLVGRSGSCAIALPQGTVSRCHAVIGHSVSRGGFYIMDLGSSNGTFINRRRLPALEKHLLHDGDLIEFSKVRVEFFLSCWHEPAVATQDTHF